MAASVAAQGQTGGRSWIRADLATASVAEDFTMATSGAAPGAREATSYSASYHLPAGFSFGVGAGHLITPRFGVAVTVERTMHSREADVSATLPHPLFLNAFATATGTSDNDLFRREVAVHLSGVWAAPTRWSAIVMHVFGGPSRIRASQEAVVNIGVDQTFAIDRPAQSIRIARTSIAKVQGSGWGFHIGADGTYFLDQLLGVGGIVRYSRAPISFPDTLGTGFPDVETRTGGFLVGATLRARF